MSDAQPTAPPGAPIMISLKVLFFFNLKYQIDKLEFFFASFAVQMVHFLNFVLHVCVKRTDLRILCERKGYESLILLTCLALK